MDVSKRLAECQKCQHQMVPRVVFDSGQPSHSICPFCGNTYKNFVEPSPWAYPLGVFLGRMWKMRPIEHYFSRLLSKLGVGEERSKSIFYILKIAFIIWIVFFPRVRW